MSSGCRGAAILGGGAPALAARRPAFEAQRRFEIREHRGDAVAGAVAHFQRAMMMDVDQSAKAMKDAEMEAEIEDFLEGFKQPTYRGIRVNGVRVPVWSSLPDRAERRGKGYVGVAIGKPSTKSFFRRKR